jgi:hypothetical protein
MKTKFQIIETHDYRLAVSNEKIVEEGDKNLTNGRDIFDYADVSEYSLDYANRYWQKVIAHQPLNNAPILKGVPLLPEMVEDDVEKLTCKEFCFPIDLFYEMKKSSQNDYLLTEDFGLQNTIVYFQCLAYIKAATKVYSEEDLIRAIAMAKMAKTHDGLIDMDAWISNGYEGATPAYTEDEIIQSLKQPKTPKWFVAEIKKGYMLNCDGEHIGFPVHDIGLKTTTINGKTYLVGTYE